MLSSKLNVYSSEWLDVVFANRNQSYGAYELRKNYNARLTKALFIASALFIGGVCSPLIYQHLKGEDTVSSSSEGTVVIPPDKIVVVDLQPKKIEPAKSEGQSKPEKVKMIRHVAPRVVPANSATIEDPATPQEIEHAVIGPITQEGTTGATNAISATTEGQGGNGLSEGVPDGTAEEVHNTGTLEVQPAFPGGFDAFANYLRKNLRYPGAAQDQGISGRVYVNFIVEKDGTLTDIKIAKGIGFGCDEEAARVIKKSPKWSAGEQNGRKVRVMFTIPIVFAMGEN
ncbi:energy transducer TonB [Desertivirga arenae]|uniref:energy transducer TonB n=1 Tax=Desertivirga arenae TaxID=2810309 RepID=UPI001A96CFF4|nr:energy transducer TonB [Pedobacter sp. SYSU D00823]